MILQAQETASVHQKIEEEEKQEGTANLAHNETNNK